MEYFSVGARPLIVPNAALLNVLAFALAGSPASAPAPAPAATTLGLPGALPLPVPVASRESARYRVSYGLLGDLGEVRIELAPIRTPGGGVRAVGTGRGSVLGMGAVEKRIESEFDPQTGNTRHWLHTRMQGDKLVEDTVDQPQPGTVGLLRRRNGKPGAQESFHREASVLDPVGFLLRLRVAPPADGQRIEVLDGRALWIMTVQAPRREELDAGTAASLPALRIDGQADPVFWDGRLDPERTARPFTVWLSDDAFRTPLRLAMPLGLGDVRVDLVSVLRTPDVRPSFVRRLLLAHLAPWIHVPGRPSQR